MDLLQTVYVLQPSEDLLGDRGDDWLRKTFVSLHQDVLNRACVAELHHNLKGSGSVEGRREGSWKIRGGGVDGGC